ncbi:PrsW family intramembrane metalloprotease [Phycicoccus sp. MAQZ13P-2]|uniref:PrsW family intramembrane metalloprotease n=1 Tax=Phycicoccus mangrovi TaxID=2840470 RepID=UPI001C002D4A|nr:PrsW family intramembrane metalloprotease [Phycicoccus mangrovi]MBT9255804.1 PrsW family intramembrane metalloprotease [Phycicoccus mangrovi]MBT9274398.1 PrsW family intramembrane metalloprotease [Phycicoccus mangrovi]
MSGDLRAAPAVTQRSDPTTRSALRSWVVASVAGVGFLVAALVVSAYLGATFGLQTVLLALAVAVVPLGIVIPTFLWLDRFESEPTRYLVAAFLWGALVATLVAAVFNTSAIVVLRSATDPDAALATTAVLVAPVVEEALKGAFVLLVWWFLRREFDGVTDGMVYAGVTAAGFAFTENIQYLAQAYTDGGREALTATFVARCLLSPFAHPMFTILTGAGIGVAATSRSWALRLLAPVGGYLLAVVAHGLWNLAAVSGGTGLVTVYVLVEVPVFLAYVAFVVWARQREGRLIGQYLRPYADAGWLTRSEVSMLSSMGRRREARLWARANAGTRGLSAMRAFQDTASELALLRRRMHHDAADEHAIGQERELLGALTARRGEFVGTAGW